MFDLFRDRDKTKKYLLTAVLSVVAISMVITLIPGITNPGQSASDDPNIIAHVCGVALNQNEVRRQVDDFTRNGQLPQAMVASYLPIIINGQIEQLAMACVATEKGFDISDQDMADEIRNVMPNLVNAKGEFDRNSYEAGVRRMNMTVPLFEERLKQQILVKRMQDLAMEGIIVPTSEVQKEYERRNVKIKMEFASVAPSALAGEVQASDADLEAFFKSSPQKNKIPEKRAYTVVYADQEKIGSTLSIADDQLKTAYNAQMERWRLPERVKVSHILILTQGLNDAQKKDALEKIKGILKRVKAGEDFGKLAGEFSEDPGSKNKGGEYDFTPRGQWVAPFEQAAFTMKPGQISDIVTTDYGYHIIKTLAREDARIKPFDEVKGTLATELQRNQVQSAMQKAIDSARNEASQNPTNLEAIAKKYNLDVVQSGGKLQANQPMPVLGAATELINGIFAAKQGQFSTVSQPQAGKLAFARVDAIEPERIAEFSEVRSQVKSAFVNMKADEIAKTKVKEAAVKLAAGEDFRAVAKSLNAEVKTSPLVGRDGAVEGLGDANAFAELFEKPVGSTVGPINPMGAFYMLGKSIEKVQPPADQAQAGRGAIVDALKKRMANERYMLFRDSVMKHLLDERKIKKNQKAIDGLVQSYLRG